MLHFFEPIPLHPYEMALLRVAFAYVLYRQLIRSSLPFSIQPRPVGLARFFDLTALSRHTVEHNGRIVMGICLVCYCVGLALPLVVPIMTVYLILRETLRNSQGALHHSRQAIALVLLVQSVVYLIQAVQESFVWWSFPGDPTPFDAWVIYGSQQAIMAIYLTAGITKVVRRGWGWIRYAPRITLQIAKSSQQKYYDRLDASFLTRAEEIMGPARRYPSLTRLVVSGGLIMELLTPLMLYSRLTLIVGGLMLIFFHRMNGRYMGLDFLESQFLLAVFFLNVPYALAHLITFFGLGS